MKYLIILISLLMLGCLAQGSKQLEDKTFCLNGTKYTIVHVYSCVSGDCAVLQNASWPKTIEIRLTISELNLLLLQADKECP